MIARALATALAAASLSCATHETAPVPRRGEPPFVPLPPAAEGGFVGVEVAANESETLETIEFFPGVRVVEVILNSPAERAGLRPRDVVLSVDGAPTNRPDAFRALVATAAPGTRLRLEVKRESRVLSLPVEVEARASPAPEPSPVAVVEETKARLRLRDRVVERGGERRVVAEIAGFLSRSPFEAVGFREGDLVLSLDGRTCASAGECAARLRDGYGFGERVRVVFEREGRRLEARVRLFAPRRVLTALRLPPLLTYERDPRADRTRWWIGDFLLFSLFRHERRGAEREFRFLSLLGWGVGVGTLEEKAK